MLANLKGLFAPQAVAQTLKTLPPLETTIMDTFFKQRPSHPLPMLGISDLKGVVQTVPVTRRDGTPVSLGGEEMETEFFAPLPIKVKVNVSAAELNDLRLMMGDTVSMQAWQSHKVEQVRSTIRNTTEGMSTGVLTTGKVLWPVQNAGGRMESYSLDYGAPLSHTPDSKLTSVSKISEVYHLLRDMEQKIRMAGIGGRVEFMCGADVTTVFLDMAEGYRSTAQDSPVRLKLENGQITIGSYVIRFMDETYPDPLTGAWVPKLAPKVLMGVAVDVPGTIFYCAIDSISAKNASVPLHIVPVPRDDDSGISLIAQSKPLPARPSRAACLCTAVD